MNIVNHISQLLYNHDCVVIPGFGGLVANYNPARINQVHQTFYPPSKTLTFNANLRHNDGLLVSYISQSEHISYPDALKEVENFSHDCMSALLDNEKLFLKGIGSFLINYEGKIEFEPTGDVNYLADAYGLNSFTLPARKKPEMKKEAGHSAAPQSMKPLDIRSLGRVMLPAAAVLVIALMVWLSQPYLKTVENLASLLTFNTPSKPSSQINPTSTLPFVEPAPEIKHVQKQENLSEETPETEANPEVSAPPETLKTPEIPENPVPGRLLRYNIIGGSFSSVENAGKAVRKFESEGYPAFMIDTPVNGFFRVCVFATKDRIQADARLSEVRNNLNPGAWLLLN